MKVSVNWVKQFTAVKLPIDKLVEKIGAQLGAVEEVVDIGEKYKDIVVVKVVECIKHPNADKLSICLIDDGGVVKGVKRIPRDQALRASAVSSSERAAEGNVQGSTLTEQLSKEGGNAQKSGRVNGSAVKQSGRSHGLVQVVCGAPNVKAGMLAAWLPPGVIVPSTFDKEQFKLEKRELRGEMSNGMLASASELALSDDHNGIVEILPNEAKPGDDFAKAFGLDDYVIDIENKMFTHRPDLFGLLGVAREVAGITGYKFESPDWYKNPVKLHKENPALNFRVDNKVQKLVTRFTAVVVRIKRNGPSPVWLQAYLSRHGMRPINIAVDFTNFYMHLTGQPLHAYDYDKLAALGKGVSLETRMSKKGDKLMLIGGKEITLEDDQTILITSHDKPVGIGGVMGGQETEVDADTKNVLLECANFDMYTIRRTAMQYGLFTDAVTRFNKGQSSLQHDKVIASAAKELTKFADGSVASEIVDKHGTLNQPKPVRVSPLFINERLGENLSTKKMTELLENVEFKVMTAAGKQLAVTPPFWRTDIEIPEDIVEEVGRLYGYDHLPLELPKRDLTPAERNAELSFKAKIRDILSRAGANEVLTYSFVHGDLIKKVGQDTKHAFQLNNAISPDLQYYRLSLTPSLLDLVHPNIKAGHDEFALFEIGTVHIKGVMDPNEPGIPAEYTRIALVFAAEPKTARQKYEGAAYYQAQKYPMTLLKAVGKSEAIMLKPLDQINLGEQYWLKLMAQPFEPKRSAALMNGEDLVGVVGEYRPEVRRALKLPAFSAGFETFHRFMMKDSNMSSYVALPRFPKVEQDITLKISAKHSYGDIFTLLNEKLAELKPDNTLANFEPLDIYQKDDEHKHITWRLSIASYERTMTDQEVNKLLDEITEAVKKFIEIERI